MLSTTHRRVAAAAIASMLALSALAADAFARSSHSRAREAAAATAASGALQSPGAGSYYHPRCRIPPCPSGIEGRGNVLDNTAGWGDVGAR
jgi:hypothetical protein